MRKYITLLAFACFLFVGLQSTTAQNTPIEQAKAKTETLHKLVDLNKSQKKKIYEIYLADAKGEAIQDVEDVQDVMKYIHAILSPKQQAKLSKKLSKEAVRQKKINSHQG